MKIKYLILKSNKCNGYWSYMAPMKENSFGRPPITSLFGDRFLNTGVEEAQQFDTREEAVKFIISLGMRNETFKIEEVYIIN